MILFTAKAIVRELGFSLTRKDGEYRLAPSTGTPAQKEARAYYTDDLDDAVGTARQEAARAKRIEAEEAHRAAREVEWTMGTYQAPAERWDWQADIQPGAFV